MSQDRPCGSVRPSPFIEEAVGARESRCGADGGDGDDVMMIMLVVIDSVIDRIVIDTSIVDSVFDISSVD